MRLVNLAKRPFENLRPVRRMTGLLWLLGAAFLAVNLWFYWGHLTGFSATRGQLVDVRAGLAEETAKLDAVEADVAALELDAQNQTVSNLNQLIEKRTFPWGLLFDRLELVLPNEVRLLSVRPEGQEIKVDENRRTSRQARRRNSRSRRPTGASATEEGARTIVAVAVNGVALTETALLDLVDALWDDPAFDQPTLKGERRAANNDIDFNLDMQFRTDVAADLAARADALEVTTADADTAGAWTDSAGPDDEVDGPAALVRGIDQALTTIGMPPSAGEATDASSGTVDPAASAVAEQPATGRAGIAARPGNDRTASEAPTRTVESSPRAATRSWRRSTRDGASADDSSSAETTGDTERRTTRSADSRTGVPVVVLPGAPPATAVPPAAVPPTAQSPAPAVPQDPTITEPARPTESPAPQPEVRPTPPDPDTPLPPGSNASPGAQLGGGAP